MTTLAARHDPCGAIGSGKTERRPPKGDSGASAIARASSESCASWIIKTIERRRPRRSSPPRVLDVGCGAGFLGNLLARRRFRVTGIDSNLASLVVATRSDETRSVRYVPGDSQRLPFGDSAFDAVCTMDLEHAGDPSRVIAEAARVLAPGGLHFFRSWSRTWLAWLVVIKGTQWFVDDAPSGQNVLRSFLRPEETTALCEVSGLVVSEVVGTRPVIDRALLQLLTTGVVPRDFAFCFTPSTAMGYAGFAEKSQGSIASAAKSST